SWPLRTSSCTPEGVMATRYSLFLTSRGTATFTRYQHPLPMHHRRDSLVAASIGRPKACGCESKPAQRGRADGLRHSCNRIDTAVTVKIMIPTLGTFWGITANTHDVFVGASLFVAKVVFCCESA